MSRRLESQEEAQARLSNEALSDPERAALWARIAASEAHKQKRGARRGAGMLLAVLGPPAAVAAALFFVRLQMNEEAAHHDPCTLDPRHKKLALGAQCSAQASVPIEGDLWELRPGAEVERTKTGAHVRQGLVRFKVRPRLGTPAFRVRVAAGEIRVIGTEFEVQESARGGSLFVREGVVELVWSDGARERVAAGQRVQWPRVAPAVHEAPAAAVLEAPASAPPPKPDAGARAAAPDMKQAPDMEQVMERLLQLKSQARHAEAVELLGTTLRARGLHAVQRERISYELGLSLEASGRPACDHWRGHAARYGVSRFGSALEQRIAGCK